MRLDDPHGESDRFTHDKFGLDIATTVIVASIHPSIQPPFPKQYRYSMCTYYEFRCALSKINSPSSGLDPPECGGGEKARCRDYLVKICVFCFFMAILIWL